MNDDMNVDHESLLHSPQEKSYLRLWIFLFFSSIWLILTSIVTQVISWFIEQGIFEGSLDILDVRWLPVTVFAFMVIVPFWLISMFVKNPTIKMYGRTWMCMGILVILWVPGRLLEIVRFQLIALEQMMATIIFLIAFNGWLLLSKKKWNHRNYTISNRSLIFIILLGGLMILPWVLWGALGSAFDTMIGLLNGLMVGVAVSIILDQGYFSYKKDGGTDLRLRDVIADGFFIALSLLIIATGIGQSGNQGLLYFSLPMVGWACVVISRMDVGVGNRRNWLPAGLLIGIAIAWPLIWIDSDELMFVIGSTDGDIFGVAMRIAILYTLINLSISILTVVFRRLIHVDNKKIKTLVLFSVFVWLGIGVSYWQFGQPGFFGERMFVILSEQTDLSGVNGISDYELRRETAYRKLVDTATTTQKELRGSMDRLGISYRPFYLVNALEVRGGPLIRFWLMNRPEVDRVIDNPVLRPLPSPLPVAQGDVLVTDDLEWNLTQINVERVWNELGIRGEGIIVGQSDSGVDGTHNELSDSYRGNAMGDDYNWLDLWYQSPTPVDLSGHGTHTLGTILGNRTGVAPDASWIGCVNLARNLGNPALYLDCMQFMLAPYPQDGDPLVDGKASLGAHILNNSWGCPEVEGCDADVFLPAMRSLRDAGIFVVVSAGNSGYSGCGSVDSPPAIYDEVYTVGAMDEQGNLTEFSSIGPVVVDGSMRVKPDIIAPGSSILSAFPGNTYAIHDGTSMAGPHVAGVVALMWASNKDILGNIELTEEILDKTASSYSGVLPRCIEYQGYPNNGVGYGVLDAYSAVKMAMEYNAD